MGNDFFISFPLNSFILLGEGFPGMYELRRPRAIGNINQSEIYCKGIKKEPFFKAPLDGVYLSVLFPVFLNDVVIDLLSLFLDFFFDFVYKTFDAVACLFTASSILNFDFSFFI